MPSARYLELQSKFYTKQDELAQLLSAGRTGDGQYAINPEEAQRRDKELDALHDELKRLEAMDAIAEKHISAKDERAYIDDPMVFPGSTTHEPGRQRTPQSLGTLVQKALTTSHQRSGRMRLDQEFKMDVPAWVETKATMLTTAGWLPEPRRMPRIAEMIAAPIEVIDLFPIQRTDLASASWMEETTSSNAAIEIAEAGLYPEAALAFTPRTLPVRKIGTWLPVSDEQLGDVPQVAGVIDNRLRYFVRKRLDVQLIAGDGIGNNLLGILNTPSILIQPKGADPDADAIYKALNQVRVTGQSNPSVVVLHPNDWLGIRLLRTIDGRYIWGDPSEVGPERIWGLPVVKTTAISEGTGLVGDFSHSDLWMRQDAQVELGLIDDQFIHGLQAIRASLRACLSTYRAQAYCAITGL